MIVKGKVIKYIANGYVLLGVNGKVLRAKTEVSLQPGRDYFMILTKNEESGTTRLKILEGAEISIVLFLIEKGITPDIEWLNFIKQLKSQHINYKRMSAGQLAEEYNSFLKENK